MNAGMSYSLESLFGPPSALIDVNAFLQSTSVINSGSSDPPCAADPTSGNKDFQQLSQEEKDVIATECSVDDLEESLYDIWNDPALSGLLLREQEKTLNALYSMIRRANARDRKKLPDPVSLPEEAPALQMDLDAVKLSSWKLQHDSALFVRASINSDQNALKNLLKVNSSMVPDLKQAVITVSIHNRLSWGPSYVSRSSQHCLLSSQTLQDLCGVIPCPSNRFPTERIECGTSDSEGAPLNDMECVICIEDLAYCNVQEKPDYSDKLLKHLEKVSKNKTHSIKKASTTLTTTPFSSLSLRINEPYWMLHHGNCEHFIVVDQIRLRHPSDPSNGYPLTTQLAPTLLDLCRACTKVPATWSIVGDSRLGESPCLLCGPCWRSMGNPVEPDVMIFPLPSFSLDCSTVNETSEQFNGTLDSMDVSS